MLMKCPKCGNEIVDLSMPCSVCGKKMTEREIKIEKLLAKKSKEQTKHKCKFLYDVGTAYKNFWTKIFDVKSLTSVKDFWYPFMINFVLIAVALLIYYWVGFVMFFCTMIPGITCAIRRIKDTGREWFYFLLLLLPGAGVFVIIVMLCLPSYYKVIDESAKPKTKARSNKQK